MSNADLDASVVITTFRRPKLLGATLEAISRLDTAQLKWELILVDNADDVVTRRLAESYSDRIPLSVVTCTDRGTSAARNAVLAQTRGKLIVHTDDDVVPDQAWLAEMVRGHRRYPEEGLFGGRVLPKFPASLPTFVQALRNEWPMLFAQNDPQLPEGPHSIFDYEPFGPNYAISRAIVEAGIRYNESIGPKGDDYVMGSESNLTQRLWHKGWHPVYLPSSVVYHQVRPAQLTPDAICARYYRHGRGLFHVGATLDYWEVKPNGEGGWVGEFAKECERARWDGYKHEVEKALGRRHLLVDLESDRARAYVAPYVYRDVGHSVRRLNVTSETERRSGVGFSVAGDRVEWYTGSDAVGQVWMSRGGRPEVILAEGARGRCILPSIEGSVNILRLYVGPQHAHLLDSVVVSNVA